MLIPQFHVANSRSGKKIYLFETSDIGYVMAKTADQDEHDQFDAYCVFEHLMIRSFKRFGSESKEFRQSAFLGSYYVSKMGTEFLALEKEALGLATSIDLVNHGKSLCKHFLRE